MGLGTNLAVIKILMEATNGLGVILENRYYGRSYPYNLSTVDNLRFLTNEQSGYHALPKIYLSAC